MDDALALIYSWLPTRWELVLILVVMDDALARIRTSKKSK